MVYQNYDSTGRDQEFRMGMWWDPMEYYQQEWVVNGSVWRLGIPCGAKSIYEWEYVILQTIASHEVSAFQTPIGFFPHHLLMYYIDYQECKTIPWRIMGSRSSGKFDTLKPTNKLRPKNDESYWKSLGDFSLSRSWCVSRRDVSLSWNTHMGPPTNARWTTFAKLYLYIYIYYMNVWPTYIHTSFYIHIHIIIDKCKFITTSACGSSGAGAEGETLQDRAGGSRSSGSKSLIRYAQDEDEDRYHEYHWHNWYKYPLVI